MHQECRSYATHTHPRPRGEREVRLRVNLDSRDVARTQHARASCCLFALCLPFPNTKNENANLKTPTLTPSYYQKYIWILSVSKYSFAVACPVSLMEIRDSVSFVGEPGSTLSGTWIVFPFSQFVRPLQWSIFCQSDFSLFIQRRRMFLVRCDHLIDLSSRSFNCLPIETHQSPFAFFTANSITAELTSG